jgi:hypothetical protein
MTIVTMPDGARVDFGDMPPDQIRSLIQRKFPDDVARLKAGDKGTVSTFKMGTAEDVARSTLTGLGEGVTQGAGLLGDVQSVADQFGTWVGDQLGLKPLSPEQQARMDRPLGLPDISAPTTAAIEKATGFDEIKHIPQTTAGKFARTAASFAVPAGVAGKGLKAAAKYGIIPGVTSEAAGQVTEGTALEPFARVGGAMVGAGGAASLLKGRKAAVPTVADLEAESRALYDAAKARGVLVSHTVFDDAIDDIVRKAQAFPIDEQLTPATWRVIQRLNEMRGTSVDLEDLDTLRKVIGLAAGAESKADRAAAMQIMSEFDRFTAGLRPADVLSGDPQAAMNDILRARSLWSRKAKAETIEQIFERARNAVGANYTAAGMQTALRQQFRQIANDPLQLRRFTKEEQGVIKEIVRGGTVENFLRLIGKFAPRGAISGGILAGATYANPAMGAALFAAGEAAKAGSTRLGMGNVRRLDVMVRTGVPQPKGPVSPGVSLAPVYTAKELQRDKRAILTDRNGVPILTPSGQYQYR